MQKQYSHNECCLLFAKSAHITRILGCGICDCIGVLSQIVFSKFLCIYKFSIERFFLNLLHFSLDKFLNRNLPPKLCWCEVDSYWSGGWELFVCIDENEPVFRWKMAKPGLAFVALHEPFETSALDSFSAIWLAPYAQDVSSGIASSSWWLKFPPLKIGFKKKKQN